VQRWTSGSFKRTPDPEGLFKDPGIFLQDIGVLLEDPRALEKGPGVI